MKNWKVKFSNSTVEFVLDGKFATIGKMVDKLKAIYITDENVYALHQQIFKGKPTILIRSPLTFSRFTNSNNNFIICDSDSEVIEIALQVISEKTRNQIESSRDIDILIDPELPTWTMYLRDFS